MPKTSAARLVTSGRAATTRAGGAGLGETIPGARTPKPTRRIRYSWPASRCHVPGRTGGADLHGYPGAGVLRQGDLRGAPHAGGAATVLHDRRPRLPPQRRRSPATVPGRRRSPASRAYRCAHGRPDPA
jgi:hypothetical protein